MLCEFLETFESLTLMKISNFFGLTVGLNQLLVGLSQIPAHL